MPERWPIVIIASDIMPYMIPITAIFGAFIAGIVAMILSSRSNERAHRERMFLAEKGLEIPKELYGRQEKKPRDFRATRATLIILGILCIVVGIGVMITVGVQEGMRQAVGAVIAILIGIGFLISERMIVRIVPRANGD